MPDPIVPPSNGDASTEPKKSLRETLEAAWDTVVENAPDDDAGGDQPQAPVDNQGQPRDEHGRFAPKDARPGEAEQRPQQAEHPAPTTETPQTQEQPHPAPEQPGVAAQAPANWSAEDRAAYQEQTDRGKAFLVRRHSEMESEFQRRVQASAAAANFAQSLAPIANDPVIAGSLREAGVSFGEAINQWAGFHRRFITDPAGMLRELVARAGIDPAALASTQPAGGALPPEIAKDPGLKLIADHLGRQNSEVLQLRNELQAMRSDSQNRQAAEVMRVTRWGIDSFAEEKDAQGNLMHPHFDAVLPHVIELFKANPKRDLREAYETALWMHSDTRQGFLQRERAAIEQRQSDQRAAQQVRSNMRGRTHPVTPPPRQEGSKRSLREALEDAADKVGLE